MRKTIAAVFFYNKKREVPAFSGRFHTLFPAVQSAAQPSNDGAKASD